LESYRTSLDGEWKQTHIPGNQQESGYGAFNFAKTLNEDSAYNAISMGFGQVMGYNYSVLGYSSAKETFNDFSKGEVQQIEGMMKFIKNYNPKMLNALQNNDYNTFGLYYNGGSDYGSKVEGNISIYRNTK
jgi:hypothetical protein